MQVKCSNCNKKNEIVDPTDDGWEARRNGTEVVTAKDGSTSVQDTWEYVVIWKCPTNIGTLEEPVVCSTTNEVKKES